MGCSFFTRLFRVEREVLRFWWTGMFPLLSLRARSAPVVDVSWSLVHFVVLVLCWPIYVPRAVMINTSLHGSLDGCPVWVRTHSSWEGTLVSVWIPGWVGHLLGLVVQCPDPPLVCSRSSPLVVFRMFGIFCTHRVDSVLSSRVLIGLVAELTIFFCG